ncbi:hypothetical protein [Parvibaculum sp.]|jgi:hypothetical protein|uniref:hypothetical protein n=1 Tax=Parvibaculum sp. TaxID=2024848 RepID=UPI002A299DEB|nr:hypothetical protein [Parvibaculum sp.]
MKRRHSKTNVFETKAGDDMTLSTIFRRLTRKPQRKKSFYESQDVMRHAVESVGPIDMRLIPETELRAIAESGSPMRREAAERELALREAHRAALSGGSAAGCP